MKIYENKKDALYKLSFFDKELHNGKLNTFKERALKDKQMLKEQIQLKANEKELNETIKALNIRKKNEEEQFNKEDEKYVERIKTLKNDLNAVKTESSITLKYENKFLEGKENAIERQNSQTLAEEESQVKSYEDKIRTEKLVNEKLSKFLEKKKKALSDEANEWAIKLTNEKTKLEAEITSAKEQLQKDTEQREAAESMIVKITTDNERMLDQEAKRKAETEAKSAADKQKEEAIIKIQAKWNKYMEDLESKKEAKKDKKKEGKKKGKKM